MQFFNTIALAGQKHARTSGVTVNDAVEEIRGAGRTLSSRRTESLRRRSSATSFDVDCADARSGRQLGRGLRRIALQLQSRKSLVNDVGQ